MEIKNTIFDEKDLAANSHFFRSKVGRILAKLMMQLVGLNKLNKVYSKTNHLHGQAFAKELLKKLNVTYQIENEDIIERLPKGAYVTVSNHPFGFIEILLVIDIIAKSKRSDYKLIANKILDKFKPLEDIFITVKPITTKSGSSIENASGLKQTITHLKNNGIVSVFPAGAVANYNESKWHVSDREWQPTIMRIIQITKAPVIPIFIHGSNSIFFNFLGRIDWQLRSIRMIREMFNKHKKPIKVTIGEPISWEEQAIYTKAEDLASFLRSKTLALKNQSLAVTTTQNT